MPPSYIQMGRRNAAVTIWALGALAAEQCKERGALHRGMRAALLIYGFFAVLACAEQALP